MKSTLKSLFVIVIAAALLSACAAAPIASTTQSPTQALTQAPTTAAVQPNTSNVALQDLFSQIYQAANPSVVNITVIPNASATAQGAFPSLQTPAPSEVIGTGFVYDTSGHIVTNNHVIENAANIVVTFPDGSQQAAAVVGADPGADLAVLKLQGDFSQLKPLTLADYSTVQVGQMVLAIGNPFGLQGSLSSGIVSGLGRLLSTSSSTQTEVTTGTNFSIPDVIQTDAPINPGNSGGPLLNLSGEVIGVNSAIETSSGTSSGVGYAIPSSIVKTIADLLIAKGSVTHAYLGISGQDLTSGLAIAMNLPATQRGVLVATVVPGGPAAAAGMQGSNTTADVLGVSTQVGGDVITAIDNVKVTTFDDMLTYIFLQTAPGQKVSLSILRAGKSMNVDVTLAARP